MKTFLTNLLAFALFIAAIVCFYFAVAGTFVSALLNFILLFSAIFFLIQGAGFVDKVNGFGKYSKPDSPKRTDDTAPSEDN